MKIVYSFSDNDEIFKGSHSSNFYSNRNSNDDDDDYKRSSITNNAKSRHRSRGRTQYRGTPGTTTTSTFKPPVVQNYTTFTPFTTKSTTPSPFKFAFGTTIRPNAPLSNVGNQLNSTPLGPLQQQYQQTNYNNNNFINFKPQSTTSAPIPTTLRSGFRPNAFNLVTTQPTFNAPLRQVVSAPTPFSNHLNNANANAKPITNNATPFTNNNNIFNNNNNNLVNLNASNPLRQRPFDNHNTINNYQTTSPFSNQRTVANHLTPNNTVLRVAQTQANHLFPQNPQTNLQRNNTFNQPILVSTIHPPTTTQPPINRNSLTPDKPSFGQQDLLNQFNSAQRKLSQPQTPAPIRNNPPEPAQTYRVQLHYDINDYLTTDKHISQSYSPTSEKYRTVQTFSTPQASNQYYTTKYYDPVFSTTPKINKQFETNNQYQTQQDRPSQAVNQQQLNFKAPINTTPQSVPKQSLNNNNINNINNNINNLQTSTKKFSTLVPKENYAPTTFKPSFYFNVAKQINDHLSTPTKLKTATDTIGSSTTTTSTTSRTVSIQPIFNRGPDFSHFKYREPQANPPQAQVQPQFQPAPIAQIVAKPAITPNAAKSVGINGEIDENDGQYHPELYEKDFARYKIKSRKKQQQLQNFQKPNFAKAQTDYNNKFQQSFNRPTQKSYSTSTEDELLQVAHSQNIAATGNELWAKSKNAENKSKQSFNIIVPAKAPTIPPNATTKKPSTIPKDDKDVSYDYAYYDSGNETPHDYSDIDLDFTKTRRQ